MKKLSKDVKFLLKVVRNSLILGGLYFLSIWTTTKELCFENHYKPVIIFILYYIFSELVVKYRIQSYFSSNPTIKRENKKYASLFF